MRLLGAVRHVGAGIIVDADGLDGLGQLPLLYGGITLRLDLSLALTVGSLGLLEDVDYVLALERVSTSSCAGLACDGLLTLLTTLPLLLMTVMVSPSPTAMVVGACRSCSYTRCGRMGFCAMCRGVAVKMAWLVLVAPAGEAVKTYQCSRKRQLAQLHRVPPRRSSCRSTGRDYKGF